MRQPDYISPDGSITLYCADCLDILPEMAAGSVDCCVTDPPYGTQELAGGYGRRQLWSDDGKTGRMIENDTDLSMLAGAFPHIKRIINTGWAQVFYAPRKTPEFIAATSADDWYGNIVWDKGAPGLGYTIRYSHEDIAVFRFGEPETPDNAIVSVIRAARIADAHPHEKPVSLITKLVRWASSDGALILDPFTGSGTTAVACIQTGRRFIGIEISPAYFEIAVRRIEKALMQPRLF